MPLSLTSTFHRELRLILFGLGFAVLPVLSGCSTAGGVSTVEGAVRLGGKPVEGGSGALTCVTPDGLRVTTPIDQTGRYLLYNPPEGALKVGVTLVEFRSLEQTASTGQEPPKSLVPARYADPKTSGLTLTVGKGKQTYDIDLQP